MQPSARYTVGFTAAVSIVGSIFVATAAVVLKDRQEANKLLDRRRKVLDVAGLIAQNEKLSSEEVNERFDEGIRSVVIELSSGAVADDIDPVTFDQRATAQNPATSTAAPGNSAGISRLPQHAVIYEVVENDSVTAVILPVEGLGLWSTMYGFIALASDLGTINGITFYEHGETPGLGGEIDNPLWRASWAGRQAFDDSWEPRIQVIKGSAPPPEQAPFEVDGLAGATITARGVTNTVQFWLGENGFGPYLERHRRERGIA